MGLVTYHLDGGIATITMDDGKVNAMSVPLLDELHAAFDRAEKDRAVVLLTGRTGIFSAGFDLKVFKQGPEPTVAMLRRGASLARRVLAFPFPVLTACNGHAYPMGAFLMLSADRRVGVSGSFRIGLNEVAIQLTLPLFAVEIARQRLTPAAFNRVVTGEMYSPEDAIGAGFLDELVAPTELAARSREIAMSLAQLDFATHSATKLRVRGASLAAIDAAIAAELG